MIEAAILSMIAVMTGCFLVELFFAHPAMHEMSGGAGCRGSITRACTWRSTIVGATVMPHNLYLHSALVQTRRIGKSVADKREACRFNLVDSVVALNGALIVNAAILVLAAAVFFKRGIIVTGDRAGAPAAGAAAWHDDGERTVRGGAAGERAKLDADGHATRGRS